MALDPIRLGSANTTDFTMESYTITTTDSAIQVAEVNALFVSTFGVFSNLPVDGTPFNGVFPNGGLPNDFLLDFSEGGPGVDLLQGEVVRLHFKFKRPDPNATGETLSRKIYVDSAINYKSSLSPIITGGLDAGGTEQESIFGFPEPVVTVKYNSATQPGIGSGDLNTLYALPGSSKSAGFPAAPDITVPFQINIGAGFTVTYFNGTAFVTDTLTVNTLFTYDLNYVANPRGWQLIRLKSDPLSDASFYDVEETWRNFYHYASSTFISRVPP